MTLSFLDRLRSREPVPQLPVFPGLAQLRAYWEALRPDGGLPGRLSIDPRGLAGTLDRVFLAERIGHGLAQIRLAGSRLVDFAGLDLRGLPLSCLFTPDSRPLLAQSLERVFSGNTLAELDLGPDRGAVGKAMARLILLPMAEERGERLLIGAIGFAETATACKFQLLARREERVTPAAPAPARIIPLQPAFAPEETGQPLRRKGHLTLVHFSD